VSRHGDCDCYNQGYDDGYEDGRERNKPGNKYHDLPEDLSDETVVKIVDAVTAQDGARFYTRGVVGVVTGARVRAWAEGQADVALREWLTDIAEGLDMAEADWLAAHGMLHDLLVRSGLSDAQLAKIGHARG
jgi:hypothetical protein